MPNIKRKIALFATNYIFAGIRPWTFPIKRYLLNWCGYKIGCNTKIVGPVYLTARLAVGENCWIGKT